MGSLLNWWTHNVTQKLFPSILIHRIQKSSKAKRKKIIIFNSFFPSSRTWYWLESEPIDEFDTPNSEPNLMFDKKSLGECLI